MASLELVVDEGSVTIRRGEAILAALGMSSRGKVEKLILSAGIKQHETMQILQVATVHALQLKAEAMRQQVPVKVIVEQLIGLSVKDLEKILNDENVEVIHGDIKLFEMAINVALRGRLQQEGVGFKLGDTSRSGEECKVKFIANKGTFQAWRRFDTPNPDLHIVPAFHPIADRRRKLTHTVNGSTGAAHSDVIRRVHAPSPSPFGGWDYVDDPFVLESKEVELTISTKLLLSVEGIRELRSILEALLGIDNAYLAVNGGFNGPYEPAGNICHRAGLPKSSRGTEGRCVWAYETLQKRKLLKGAHIPSWFLAEGWLELYKEHGKKR